MSAPTDKMTIADDTVDPGLLTELRRYHATGVTKSLAWRTGQLAALERMLDECEDQIVAALDADLGRAGFDAWLGDITSTKGEAVFARKNLKKWMKPQRQPMPLTQFPVRGWVQYEPLGVVLVISPWNYPVYLALGPLVGAIAAGDCAVVKPSELAPASSQLLARIVPQYLDSRAFRVVEGDATTTQDLLALGFDHALFTGGTEVAKKIMAGAAPTLTPVTLELGGKSPVYVAADADIDVAARRITWTKLLNSGQTCIAPDYVLADPSIVGPLVEKMTAAIARFRADQDSPTVPIVNERQFDRLAQILAQTSGKVVLGGGLDREAVGIEPTIVLDPDADDAVMQQEIFGPILPVLTMESPDAAIAFVNARPKPLANYVFSSSTSLAQRMVDSIPSGGAVINHVAMHCLIPGLPFGGVGSSGMGAYHGRWGFEALSHRKAVLSKPTKPDLSLVYPPYTDRARKLLRWML